MKKERIVEWVNDPVTRYLLKLFEQEFDDICSVEAVDCFVPGQPQKTQENLIELEARQRCWGEMVSFLKGEWDDLAEESDE